MGTYRIKYYFGDAVRCVPYPAMQQWQTRSFPGADGETAVAMGRPARMIVVTGQYRERASDYATGVARIYNKWINPMAEKFDGINNWEYDDLLFKSCILLSFEPEPMFRSGGDVVCKFTATIKALDIS